MLKVVNSERKDTVFILFFNPVGEELEIASHGKTVEEKNISSDGKVSYWNISIIVPTENTPSWK
jgi:hypothetical protein